jgi:hypothetical protein
MHWNRWSRHGSPEYTLPPAQRIQFLHAALGSETDECLLWPFSMASGRPRIKINRHWHIASRYICEHAHGVAPSAKHEAAHSCGNGHLGCMNPRHIRWATKIENENDKIAHGTHNRGQRHGIAKLTEQAVLEIKRGLQSGESERSLASIFSVSRGAINSIREGRSWAWLK